MITLIRNQSRYGTWLEDVRCLSTDEKPIENIHNGSTCIEIDTGKKYLFDSKSKTWNEIDSSVISSATGVWF